MEKIYLTFEEIRVLEGGLKEASRKDCTKRIARLYITGCLNLLQKIKERAGDE